ncbi:short-chain dehydrogenase/reductase family protein [Scheffersomyces xylosifermentans]|uniref:short-chain dehydrogenase/reductase family protein n=1 Tax=Scheffersomyces xylosifermentans TaxID=1304137 RepID=UPI00315D3850
MAGKFDNSKDIKGKVALITGGTTNLGGATAHDLASLGVNLFLHYRTNQAAAEKTQKDLQAKYPDIKVEIYQGALTKASDLTKLFDAAKAAFPKGIDIAINNIGKVVKKPLIEVTEEEFDELDLVNHKVAFFFLKEAGLKINDNGRIVSLVTSLLAAYTPFYSPYQGTKAPVEFYTKALSKELGERGISVNAVAPGPMDTSFLHGSETKEAVGYLASVGLNGRLTEVSDIVPIIRLLVSDGAWVTGQTVFASGGFTAR